MFGSLSSENLAQLRTIPEKNAAEIIDFKGDLQAYLLNMAFIVM